MRLTLRLSIDTHHNKLTYNYNYHLASWIYRMLHYGNPHLSSWLHEQGHTSFDGKRHFRLFSFSQLRQIEPYLKRPDHLLLRGTSAELVLCFWLGDAAEAFVIGMFRDQKISIREGQQNCVFYVTGVEREETLPFGSEVDLVALSPLVLSRKVENLSTAEYLNPVDPEYGRRFWNNLLSKYAAARKRLAEDLRAELCTAGAPSWQLLGKARSKLITIRPGRDSQTQVRAFEYRFRLQGPEELLEFGYHAGFGEKTSMGFGCVGMD